MFIFTDGSCISKGQKSLGGWSYIIVDNNFKEIKKDYGKLRKGHQSCNRAEIESVAQALKSVLHIENENIVIYTDNKTIIDCINGDSLRTANRDIWDSIEDNLLILSERNNVSVKHIKGHTNLTDKFSLFNEETDRLAKLGANSLLIAPVQN